MGQPNEERKKFFEASLLKLRNAASNGFKFLQTTTISELDLIQKFEIAASKTYRSGLLEDAYSKSIYPMDSDDSQHVPVQVLGDGNCAYRAMSVHVFGDEEFHTEMRVRIEIELANHCDFYLHDAMLGESEKNQRLERRLAQTTANGRNENLRETFECEVLETVKRNTWAGIWQICAFASVSGHPVKSLYPNTNSFIKDDLNRIIQPRNTTRVANDVYRILWTRVSADNASKWWKPNHFVPCIPCNVISNTMPPINPPVKQGMRKLTLADFIVKKSYEKIKQRKALKRKQTVEKNQDSNMKDIKPDQDGNIHDIKSDQDRKIQDIKPDLDRKIEDIKPDLDRKIGDIKPDLDRKIEDIKPDLDRKIEDIKPDLDRKIEDIPLDQDNKSRLFFNPILGKSDKHSSQEIVPTKTFHTDIFIARAEKRSKKKEPEVKTKTTNRNISDFFHKITPIRKSDVSILKDTATLETPARDVAGKLYPQQLFKMSSKQDSSSKQTIGTDIIKPPECGGEIDYADVLPLKVSKNWYKAQGETWLGNRSRSLIRDSGVIMDDNKIIGIQRSAVKENLQTCSQNIEDCLKSCKPASQKYAHLTAVNAVCKNILSGSPVLLTQKASEIYQQSKYAILNKGKQLVHKKSAEVYELLSKYLCIMQIYIHGRAYITEDRGERLRSVIEDITEITKSHNEQKSINDHVRDEIGSIYQQALEYLDSARDRDTITFLLTKITSVNFMTALQNKKSRKNIVKARDIVPLHIKKCNDFISTYQYDKGLSEIQKRCILRRAKDLFKKEQLQHNMEGRGRMLKCEHHPNLVPLLEYEFGEGDMTQRGGGGLEAHSRLTTGLKYRASQNKTRMLDAREAIIASGPKDFNISISTCYNYTQNYKKGTYQAKRHHEGKDINAMISLHRAPKTAVVKEGVVNAHYCSSGISFLADFAAENKEEVMIDSKDAKAVIRCNNSLGGSTWTVIEAPDHDWDQSRTNGITPMGHLFLDTKITRTPNPLADDVSISTPGMEGTVLYVTRSGKAVYLLNLSYFEPETIYRCFNEIFLLLADPSLDEHFRNILTGKLKSTFVFIVDNGPSECPNNPMLKMLLVRFLKYLNLDRVIQTSNAEYYSKRNFVEVVHASINLHIKRHGVIKSDQIFKDADSGSPEHIANMEAVAKELQQTIRQAKFGGNYIKCSRGIGSSDNFVFDDEAKLRKFMSLSEQRKLESEASFSAQKNKQTSILNAVWNTPDDFAGKYSDDYLHIMNDFNERTTAFCGKYCTAIFRCDDNWRGAITDRYILQPLPDYVQYVRTGQLHYMSYEMRKKMPQGPWDTNTDTFLPEDILTLSFKVISYLTEDVSIMIALLSWCTVAEVERFFQETRKQMEKEVQNDIERNRWQNHDLYKKSKDELQLMCNKNGINSMGTKLELVQKLAEKMNIQPPERQSFAGDLTTIPDTIQGIHRLNVSKIKEVLAYFQIPTLGSKDELAMRLLALRLGSRNLIFQKEIEGLLDLINICKDMIFSQKSLYICNDEFTLRKRRHGKKGVPSISEDRPRESAGECGEKKIVPQVPIPYGINEDSLDNIFDTLSVYIDGMNRKKSDDRVTTERAILCEPGSRILVYWDQEELKQTEWKAGWFPAKVIKFDLEKDEICIEYVSEENKYYDMNVKKALEQKIIKSARSTMDEHSLYDQIIEVGTRILVKWTKDDLNDSAIQFINFILFFIPWVVFLFKSKRDMFRFQPNCNSNNNKI